MSLSTAFTDDFTQTWESNLPPLNHLIVVWEFTFTVIMLADVFTKVLESNLSPFKAVHRWMCEETCPLAQLLLMLHYHYGVEPSTSQTRWSAHSGRCLETYPLAHFLLTALPRLGSQTYRILNMTSSLHWHSTCQWFLQG